MHPPIVRLLRLLNADRPRRQDDLFDLLVEGGHSRKQANAALAGGRKRDYAEVTERVCAPPRRLQQGRRAPRCTKEATQCAARAFARYSATFPGNCRLCAYDMDSRQSSEDPDFAPQLPEPVER